MFRRRKSILWLFLLVFAGTMVTVAGCGPKEEVTDKGYYTGAMKKKGGGGTGEDAPGSPGAPVKKQ